LITTRPHPHSTLLPYTTLFRSSARKGHNRNSIQHKGLMITVKSGCTIKLIFVGRVDLCCDTSDVLQKRLRLGTAIGNGAVGVVGHVEVDHIRDLVELLLTF